MPTGEVHAGEGLTGRVHCGALMRATMSCWNCNDMSSVSTHSSEAAHPTRASCVSRSAAADRASAAS